MGNVPHIQFLAAENSNEVQQQECSCHSLSPGKGAIHVVCCEHLISFTGLAGWSLQGGF